MRHLLAGLVVAFSSVLTSVNASAQASLGEGSLRGFAVKLGMSEADVRRTLSDHLDMKPVPSTKDVVFVTDRSGELVGTINFDSGRVVMVTENWPIEVASEEAIGNVLFRTLERLTSREESGWRLASNCSIGTIRAEAATNELLMAEIECGLKTVALTVQRDPRARGRLVVQLRTGAIPRRK